MNIINDSLSMLGQKMKDQVTGFSGMVSSINFDAYGCVQALITPPVEKGKLSDSQWFDVKRLNLDGKRIMPQPSFSQTKFGHENGSNRLPRISSAPLPGNR